MSQLLEDLNALDKRTVRLDALATDEEGNLINIEVQRSVSPVLTKRARYHSALLDTNSLERSSFEENFEKAVINQTDIPDVFKCLLIHNR